jgi:outer membrane protein OmpU
MKKLLSTTAFLGALAITAGSAEAANLQVNVGGFLDFQAGYTNDDIVGDGNTLDTSNDNRLNFNTDSEIHFTVEGTADNGLEYGAVIELEADVDNTDVQQNGGGNADKAYLFTQGAWGRLEGGNNTDAAEALSVNSATFASGTGGVDGDFYRYAGSPTLAAFVIRPDLPLANAGAGASTAQEVDEDATRLTYYTPRIAGFQAGASFTPNSNAVGFTAPSTVGIENAWSGGVNFTTQWDMFAIKLAATGERGQMKNGATFADDDLRAWDLGGNVSFAGFTVGGSYAHLGHLITDDGQTTSGGGVTTSTAGNLIDVDGAHYWDAGVGYAWGPFSASASYLNSKVDPLGAGDDNKFNNIVVGVDYKAAPGLVPYAEVSRYDFNGAGGGTTVTDNNGYAVIVGSQLTF